MKTEIVPDNPEKIFLKDYQPPVYGIRHARLEFELSPQRTKVIARLQIGLNPHQQEGAPLILDGEHLELLSVRLDGQDLGKTDFEVTEKNLTIHNPPPSFTLETEVLINPAANTRLSGLYMSNGMFCTQCEAEGFRNITYYMDRPDVLATFDVRIEANRESYPVLLSNGNPGQTGDLPAEEKRQGWHFAEWSDPHPKPAYLFALVAGALACVEDEFTTRSNRKVALRVFVQPENVEKCDYTLDALKRSMLWDEEVFDREYDLDIFMIVAVDHFNFGAMENKGLNIFNSAYVLASPETATDLDYELIESIVAHEYFHNWSGNRVTCRDWFQLCLKEGFTVFRDQEFSADQRSRPVQRIKDVRRLWQRQFPEDAGPLAHPARPESYITIDNFYTATVYDKGAELVRMMQTLLGKDAFKKATDLYFSRHDGEAATIEDFIICMEEAGGKDLEQFRRWYSDAGTPVVTAKEQWDNGTYTLSLAQHTDPTPGQPTKLPRQIPVSLTLVGEDGPLKDEQLIELTDQEQTLTFEGLESRPVASLFRHFSAPIVLQQEMSIDDRLRIIAHDTDAFNRWSTANTFATDLIASMSGESRIATPEQVIPALAEALQRVVTDEEQDPTFRAEILQPPGEMDIARLATVIDPDKIIAARKTYRLGLLNVLRDDLLALYSAHTITADYSPAPEQAGRRALKNAALALLLADENDDAVAMATKQAGSANNMSDEGAAVSLMARTSRPEKDQVLSNFYDKWHHDTLVTNKWLAWQAMATHEAALEQIKKLTEHESFDLKNPNKVRSLVGAFAMNNLGVFHRADGGGYRFFFEMIRSLDPINPQVAARLLTAAESWRKLELSRQKLLGGELKQLASESGLSRNLFEMAERLSG